MKSSDARSRRVGGDLMAGSESLSLMKLLHFRLSIRAGRKV